METVPAMEVEVTIHSESNIPEDFNIKGDARQVSSFFCSNQACIIYCFWYIYRTRMKAGIKGLGTLVILKWSN